MLYETLLQPSALLWILCAGFLCGFLFDAKNFVMRIFKNNRAVNFIFDFGLTVLCAVVLFIVVLETLFGAMRVWQVLCFSASFAVQRFSIGQLLAKKMGV